MKTLAETKAKILEDFRSIFEGGNRLELSNKLIVGYLDKALDQAWEDFKGQDIWAICPTCEDSNMYPVQKINQFLILGCQSCPFSITVSIPWSGFSERAYKL